VATLSEDLIHLIEGATSLDRQLYQAALLRYDAILADHEYSFKLDEEVWCHAIFWLILCWCLPVRPHRYQPFSHVALYYGACAAIFVQVEAFVDMQKMLADICSEHPNTMLCRWYSEPDFYALYADVGFSLPVV